jgi:maltose O-acetyltransferase
MDGQSEREKMMAGQCYLPADPELVTARMRARSLVHSYGGSDPRDTDGRRAILSRLFNHIGDNVVVEAPFHCDYGWNVSLEDGVYINVNCVMLDCAPITVGAHAQIGPCVQLCTATHPLEPDERRQGLEYALPIVIGTNVWIAAGVVVGPGVTIGDNSTLGAGSVVLEDVPANVLVAGNPARIVRRL